MCCSTNPPILGDLKHAVWRAVRDGLQGQLVDAVLVEERRAGGGGGVLRRRVYAAQDDASQRYVHARDLFAVRALLMRNHSMRVLTQLCDVVAAPARCDGAAAAPTC